MKDDEKRGETPRFLLCFFPRKYKYKYLAWGLQCGVPSGRLPRRFAPRNDIECVARKAHIIFVEMRAYS